MNTDSGSGALNKNSTDKYFTTHICSAIMYRLKCDAVISIQGFFQDTVLTLHLFLSYMTFFEFEFSKEHDLWITGLQFFSLKCFQL